MRTYSISVAICLLLLLGFIFCETSRAATTQKKYYAYKVVEDKHGVIAPWYRGQNGQFDNRVRLAVETLKRYPWYSPPVSITAAPAYMLTGSWKISPQGQITPLPETDHANGDLVQRGGYTLYTWIRYYRYSGDAAALAHINILADHLCDHCQTPEDHSWPKFLISVPNKGKPLFKANPHGRIQLDIVGETGRAMVEASQMTGNARWLDAAEHWGEVLAEKRNRDPDLPPWNRYANPESAYWNDIQSGGVILILPFFDSLIAAGRTGKDNCIVEARKAAVNYLQNELLPNWSEHETWSRQYWDWWQNTQAVNITVWLAQYMMDRPQEFPNWQADSRNIMGLFINRACANPKGNGDAYHGAWAFPEDSSCCDRSLWYAPFHMAEAYSQYAAVCKDPWAREMARRQLMLSTYATHPTGVVEDNIDGGAIVAGGWFKIAHITVPCCLLSNMAWLPDVFGAQRENHIMRSSTVVKSVAYRKSEIDYTTHTAAENSVDVLRLAFVPKSVQVGDHQLSRHEDLKTNGYTVEELPCGDVIISIRHDGQPHVVVRGDDPQQVVDDDKLAYQGEWKKVKDTNAFGSGLHVASKAGAAVEFAFDGNQVRLMGCFGPQGGLAEVYLDGKKQLVGIDCWNPTVQNQQLLYSQSGLSQGRHTLKIVALGKKNPRAGGTDVMVDSMQYSAATGDGDFGEGGGPTTAQRMIFGRAERKDYIDTEGNAWRPCMQYVTRCGQWIDTVESTWWTRRRRITISDTPDAELYRYGVHAPEFWANVTVGPGKYDVRVKLCATLWENRAVPRKDCVMNISINSKVVSEKLNVKANAGGFNKALDLVFPNIEPKNGMIEIRFKGVDGAEAMAQALEVTPAKK